MRDVLTISYLYPPVENAGTRRIASYVRHLPESGYRPVVLTTSTRGSLPADGQMMTFRAGEMFGGLKQAYRASYFARTPSDQQANLLVNPRGMLGALVRHVAIPDMQITWYWPALRQARRLMRKFPFKAIFSTSGPETNHLVALALKRKTRLPWVADFRDGWLFEPPYPERLTAPLRYRIEGRLERSVVSAADRIIVINELFAEDIRRRYPQCAHKVTVLSNGFEAEDFVGLERHPSGRFRIVHTGAVSLSRAGTALAGLLEALARLGAEQNPILHDLEFVMAGNLTAAEIDSLESFSDLFQIAGYVSHREALQHQVDAEALLLVTHPSDRAISTTKLFEYLAAGRPILALTPPESAAAGIIREVGAGLIAPPTDAAQIRQALLSFYSLWQQHKLGPCRNPAVQSYEYRSLTQRLAACFDALVR
jgi:glycosyltransferase involved in cell wall biosynthesis